jgi:hypothetical protein
MIKQRRTWRPRDLWDRTSGADLVSRACNTPAAALQLGEELRRAAHP